MFRGVLQKQNEQTKATHTHIPIREKHFDLIEQLFAPCYGLSNLCSMHLWFLSCCGQCVEYFMSDPRQTQMERTASISQG